MKTRCVLPVFIAMLMCVCVSVHAEEVENEDKFNWAAKEAGSIVKVSPQYPVAVEYFEDRDRMHEVFLKFFRDEYPEDKYEAINAVMLKFGFGLFDEMSEDEIVDEMMKGVLGVYDDEEDRIYVVTPELYEELRDERYDECNIDRINVDDPIFEDWYRKHQSDIVLTHESMHALQNQIHNIFEIREKFKHNDDAYFGSKTLIEGQAEFVETHYFLKALNINFNVANYINYGESWDFRLFAIIDEYVEERSKNEEHYSCDDTLTFLGWMSTIPYVWGNFFMEKVAGERGYAKTNDTFTRCPLSSEQILTSDKYFSEKDEDRPTFINLPSFDDIIDTDEWRYLDYNSMGQLKLYLLCRDLYYDPDTECQPMAEGWDGDRYVVWRNSDDEILIAWYTTWDNIDDAEEFYSFYQLANKKKNISSGNTSSGDDYNMTLAGEDSMFIQIKGQDVIILEGPLDEDGFFEFADLLWDSEKYEAAYDICSMTAAEFNDGYAGYTGENLDDNESDEGEDEDDGEED